MEVGVGMVEVQGSRGGGGQGYWGGVSGCPSVDIG